MGFEQVPTGFTHEMRFWGERIHCFTPAEYLAQAVFLFALGVGEAHGFRNLPRAKQ